jgi:uncharacterized membrane protein
VIPDPDSDATLRRVGRLPSERRRATTAAAGGIVLGGLVAAVAPWEVAVLAGWDAGAVGLLTGIWLAVRRLDAAETAALATREDDSRAATRVIIVLAAVVSLSGVAFALHKSNSLDAPLAGTLEVLSIVTVILSWALVHVVYMLRYAHLYYDGTPGGITFPGGDAPDYGEFAYVAFTIGMTYQVSDTELTSRAVRRALLRHAVLSYLFGVVIVALTINVVIGLGG